jgi:tetratricopeptide (TPR) repeat protein
MRAVLLSIVAVLLLVACGAPVPPAEPALEDAEAYVERGRDLGDQGLHVEAIEDFTAAIEMDPNSADGFFLRGRTHYDYAVTLAVELTGQPPEAVPFLPDEVTEQMELAIADYTYAIELDPEYAKAYNNRGNARATLGDLELALEDYDRALELDSSLTLTYFNRGALYYGLRNYEAAISDMEEYLELVPDAEDRGRVEELISEMKEATAP